MLTIHWSPVGLDPSRSLMSGSATLSDELPATISTKLRHNTASVYQRRESIRISCGVREAVEFGSLNVGSGVEGLLDSTERVSSDNHQIACR